MTTLPNITEAASAADEDLLYLYESAVVTSPDRRITFANLLAGFVTTTALTATLASYSTTAAMNAAIGGAVADRAQIVAAPASAGDTGTAGQIAYDASYLYVCVAADTWLRAGIVTW